MTVTYDANGNRNNGSYTTGTGNRMTADGTWTYTWDDEGNLIKKSQGAEAVTWIYVWDEKNELVQVKRSQTDGGAVDLQADYRYDPYGNRIEKSVDNDGAGAGGATVTRFAYDGFKNVSGPTVGNEAWDIWADLNGSSSLTTRYLRGDVIDQLFARVDSGTTYWELTDRLGSIRDVVDNSAVVKDSITYNGFGQIISESDANYRGRYAWTGRELDTETSLQYNRARYYDPATSRWISQDPLGFDAGDSNLYRYVRNLPTTHVDPSGLVLWSGHVTVSAWGGAYAIHRARLSLQASANETKDCKLYHYTLDARGVSLDRPLGITGASVGFGYYEISADFERNAPRYPLVKGNEVNVGFFGFGISLGYVPSLAVVRMELGGFGIIWRGPFNVGGANVWLIGGAILLNIESASYQEWTQAEGTATT